MALTKTQIKPIVEGQTGKEVATNIKSNFDLLVDETNKKQEILKSGVNIATINGKDITRGGDITIEGGGGSAADIEQVKNDVKRLESGKVDKTTYELEKKGFAKSTEIPKRLSDLTEDAAHRLVTDAEKQKWNSGTGGGGGTGGSTISSFDYSENKLTISTTSGNFIAELPKASSSENGLMTKEQAKSLATIENRMDFNKPMVQPVISGKWTYYKQNGEEDSTINSSNAEYGYKAKFKGTWKWTATEGRKNPMRAVSAAFGNTLKESGVSSAEYVSLSYVETNQSVAVDLYADKSGLVVSGSNVVAAEGEDKSSASTNPNFRHRVYYGQANVEENTLTESVIKGLGKTEIRSSKAYTEYSPMNAKTDSSSRFLYAYPKTLGNLSEILDLSNGKAPILGAFKSKEVNVDTGAGKSIAYLVYFTNQKGSFIDGSKLKIS